MPNSINFKTNWLCNIMSKQFKFRIRKPMNYITLPTSEVVIQANKVPKGNQRNSDVFGGSSFQIVVDWVESFAARGFLRDGELTDALFTAAFLCLCLTHSCVCREFGNVGYPDGRENFTG